MGRAAFEGALPQPRVKIIQLRSHRAYHCNIVIGVNTPGTQTITSNLSVRWGTAYESPLSAVQLYWFRNRQASLPTGDENR